ncbi:MAG: MMPL family transporter [Verrucomicrobiota bacterium]
MIGFLLKRPGINIAIAALVAIAFAWAATSLRVDNTPGVWLPSDLEELDDLREFEDRFGEDAPILVYASEALVGDARWESAFSELAGEIQALPEIGSVVEPRYIESALGGPPIASVLVDSTGGVAGLAILVDEDVDFATRATIVGKLESLIEQYEPRLGSLHLAGSDVITHDLDAGSKESLGRLSPIVFGLMSIVIWVTLRSWRALVVGLATVVGVSIISLGIFALAGKTLNLVVVTMPAILAVVTVAQFMHLFSRYQNLEGNRDGQQLAVRSEWWSEAIAATWKPCALSAVTTAAGFFAIGFSEIGPIRNLGIFTGIGVLVAFVLTFTLAPSLLLLSRKVQPRNLGQVWWTQERAGRMTGFIKRRSGLILLASTLIIFSSVLGIRQLTVESNILSFFPESHRVPRNYQFVQEHLFGLTPIELVIEGPRKDVLTEETFSRLNRFLESAIQTETLVQEAISPLFVSDPDDRSQITFTLSPENLAAALPRDANDLSSEQRAYFDVDGGHIVLRTTLAAQTDSSNACHALVQRLETNLTDAFPESVRATLTGSATVLIQGQVLLLETQIHSFLLALGVVSVFLLVTFRSFKILLISLVPNVLPVCLTLGFMALLEIPLNTATVTVAGIALGIIVDDTVHFLHEYWRSRAGRGTQSAITAALYHVGRPIMITTMAVAIGFGAFALAPFKPTLYFGLLIATTAVAAVISDFLILPALLLKLDQLKSRGKLSE